jgi:hypothetical protein
VPRSVKAAAPIVTSTFVRGPAVRCRHCRRHRLGRPGQGGGQAGKHKHERIVQIPGQKGVHHRFVPEGALALAESTHARNGSGGGSGGTGIGGGGSSIGAGSSGSGTAGGPPGGTGGSDNVSIGKSLTTAADAPHPGPYGRRDRAGGWSTRMRG